MRSSALLVSLALLGATACSSTNDASGRFSLMDAPPAGVTAVNIWVAAIQVHLAASGTQSDPNDASLDDDAGWHSLAVNRSIDLVAHQGESAADVLGELPLPLGKITQIRLVLDTAQPNFAVKDGAACALDTNKVAVKGIKISHVFKAFEVKAGDRHDVLIDFDLAESMKAKDSCFVIEPKLKLHKVTINGAPFAW